MSALGRASSRLVIRRLVAVFVFCAALAATVDAHAAVVAILSTGSSPAVSEATYRLRGELSALRLDVVLLRHPSTTPLRGSELQAWLEATARARGIDAAIEVIGYPTPEAVDVWIFERAPRRSEVARVVLEPNAPDRAGTLAIRAIEVLRSSSLEADLAAKARARTEAEATRPAESPPLVTTPGGAQTAAPSTPPGGATESAGRAGLELGAALLTSLSGVGPALLPVLRLDFRASASLLVHATLSGWGTRPTLRASAGTVQVGQGYGTLGLCYCPAGGPALRPYLALSLGASRTSLVGSAELPERAHSVEHWSLLMDVGAGARLRLTERYYATLTGHAQLAQSRTSIHVVDERVGSTGRPNLIANLMVGAWL